MSDTQSFFQTRGQTILCWIMAIICGVGVSLVTETINRVEPWDDKYYWLLGYPMVFVSAILSYHNPTRPWRWGIVIVAAQMFWVIFQAPGQAILLPLTLVFFGFLSIPVVLAGVIAASLRQADK